MQVDAMKCCRSVYGVSMYSHEIFNEVVKIHNSAIQVFINLARFLLQTKTHSLCFDCTLLSLGAVKKTFEKIQKG